MRALDLFAGVGWGVACQRLGIEEFGIENAPAAVATREAAGFATPVLDAWDGLLDTKAANTIYSLHYDLLIASPPCQTFSVAGKGAGRAALDRVLASIANQDYRAPGRLLELSLSTDPRTALVLTPLAYAWRDFPRYIVWEQVPAVLPVWEACAEVLEHLGYSVWTGNLHAEQYGVPQTRKRAFLIARRDGHPAMPPTPTHSKYHSRTPQKLDKGVKPWVSMAEALGWEAPERESWILRSNYGTGGDASNRGERTPDEPAPTLTSKADRNKWIRPDWTFECPATTVVAGPRLGGPGRSEFVKGGISRQDRPGSMRLTAQEAAILQTFPADFPFQGTKTQQFLQIGNAVPPLLAEAVIRAAIEPTLDLPSISTIPLFSGIEELAAA